MKNWLGSFMNMLNMLEDCLNMLLPCFRKMMSDLERASKATASAAVASWPPITYVRSARWASRSPRPPPASSAFRSNGYLGAAAALDWAPLLF